MKDSTPITTITTITTGTARPFGRSAVAVFAVAALLAATPLSGGALAAGERAISDEKFDTVALSRNGRIDITEASAFRKGTEIKHAIEMRAKLKPAHSKERPSVLINTRGGRRSAAEYLAFGSTIFEVPKKGDPRAIGNASLTAKRRTWRFTFDAGEIPDLPDSYGWAAITQKGDEIADIAPDEGYANSPR